LSKFISFSNECLKEEGQCPAYCVDTLPGRSPDTVSAVMVNTQQDRVWTDVGRLERCRELHRVGGNRPQIVFCCREKRCGVLCSGANIVQRRQRKQRAELLSVGLSIPEFCHQVRANGETLVAEDI
jgi:hypothetical protein